MRRRILSRLLTGVALIGKGDLDRGPRDVLHLGRHLCHLRPLLLTGSGHMQGQQIAQGIDRHMDLAAALAFPPS
jgi:hypothetical protein